MVSNLVLELYFLGQLDGLFGCSMLFLLVWALLRILYLLVVPRTSLFLGLPSSQFIFRILFLKNHFVADYAD